jgi:hypothetical protein
MAQFDGNFQRFDALFSTFSAASFKEEHKNFAVEEFKRFRSIGGTVLANFPNTQTSA